MDAGPALKPPSIVVAWLVVMSPGRSSNPAHAGGEAENTARPEGRMACRFAAGAVGAAIASAAIGTIAA